MKRMVGYKTESKPWKKESNVQSVLSFFGLFVSFDRHPVMTAAF
jgi:hypothetical protein